jgi:hypothetical protein
MELTQARLRELLHYEPETGLWTWLLSPTNCVRAGAEAGSINVHGYWVIKILGKLYYAHRLAWLYVHGYFPPELIDHINSDKSDNRIANLREASHSQNNQNRGAPWHNRLGMKGIYRVPSGRYVAQIMYGGIKHYLGTFDTLQEAKLARRQAELQLFGEFANVEQQSFKDRARYWTSEGAQG